MLCVSQNYKTGVIALERTEAPALRRGGVLVRSAFSVISAGTEGMKVREAKMNYLEKARARPDHVKKVMQSVRQQGVLATYQKVMNRLDSLTPLGYSLSGIVTAVGGDAEEFAVGQRVACAGVGYANHAEINFVPKNLVVPIPDGVSMEHAAFATIGSIAMHGVRQADLRLGETAVVIGLGLVGQMVLQIARASGVSVIGVDIDPGRCALAMAAGAVAAGAPDDATIAQVLGRVSDGHGADAVLMTVGVDSNDPLELALDLVRDRGRVVVVGKSGLDLPYVDCFRKEVEFRFSRSYGPGRYDPLYEEGGVDYPLGYVRWTERRNLAAVLDLMAKGMIDVSGIIDAVHPFESAVDVYESMNAGSLKGIGILFRYRDGGTDDPASSSAPASKVPVPTGGAVRIGVVGAGAYASSMLLPHLRATTDAVLAAVATATPLSSVNAARKFGFARHGTDYRQVIADSDIDAVLIATRHASHAAMTAEALTAGKTVFVEKPLSIDAQGVEQVISAVEASGNDRLQVGFNRRFSPSVLAVRGHFRVGAGPLMMSYRVHAGPLEAQAWQRSTAEGGRFVGEAGHFLDVFSFLTEARPLSVSAAMQHPPRTTGDEIDNLAVVVTYADGSVGTLMYLTQGSQKTEKEYLEVFGQGRTAQLYNFDRVVLLDGSGRTQTVRGQSDKGQKAQMEAFVKACRTGGSMPIPFDSLVETTRVTLAALDSLRTGQVIYL
jgi:predicted dehydrogenase/threonine dehydrogenase-like Zn-dependent dehydrogenase